MTLALPPGNSGEEITHGRTHGYEEYQRTKGSGANLLRTAMFAQPRTLRPGDILANGDRVLANPREGYNGDVYVLLSGGWHGHWMRMPARLPIALLVETDTVPEGFVEEMQE